MSRIRFDAREPDDADNWPPELDETVGDRLRQAEAQLKAVTEDNHTLRAALWEIHRLLTSDGSERMTPRQIIAHVETTLRWNGA